MKQLLLTTFSCLLAISSFANITTAPPGEGGCGSINLSIHSIELNGPQDPTLKDNQSKDGEHHTADPLCTTINNRIMISVEGLCDIDVSDFKGENGKMMDFQGVKLIAYPASADQPPFDCDITGEDGIFNGNPLHGGGLNRLSSNKDEGTSKGIEHGAIYLGEIPLEQLCQQRWVWIDGTAFTGSEATINFNTVSSDLNWPIISGRDGMYYGFIDLSPLAPGGDYKVCAFLCGAPTCEDDILTGAIKGDNSKNGDLEIHHTCIDVATAAEGTCPKFEFTDPCACGDPLNIIEDGEVVRFHERISSGPADPGLEFFFQPTANRVYNLNEELIENGSFLPMTYENGEYIIDFLHEPGSGYTGTVHSSRFGAPVTTLTNVCDNICPRIPTIGQWGLFILLMLLSSLGLVFMKVNNRAVA